MSYKEIVPNNSKVNQIGNFVSLSIGAGNTVVKAQGNYLWAGYGNPSTAPFKVNRQTGALSATGAIISGAITATGGSITGDMTVTGSITAGSSPSVVMQGSTGKLLFKRSGTERGAIYVDSSNRLQFSANGSDGMYFNSSSQLYIKNDIFVTNGSIYGYNDVYSANGSVYAYNDVYSSHGAVHSNTGDVYATNGSVWSKYDIYTTNGSLRAYNDIYTDHGSIRAYNDIYTQNGRFKCQGKYGIDWEEDMVSDVWVENGNKIKYNTINIKFKGGILYSKSNKDGHTAGTIS